MSDLYSFLFTACLDYILRELESCSDGRPIQKEAGRRYCLCTHLKCILSLKDLFLATKTSWEREYKGVVADQLWKYVKKHFNTSSTSKTYAHYTAIVQSSGTGKSRAVDELAKLHFVIPLCLRHEEELIGAE